MPASRYVEKIRLPDMLVTKKSAGVLPDVNLRKHVTRTPLPSVNKAAHCDFETKRRYQKSKTDPMDYNYFVYNQDVQLSFLLNGAELSSNSVIATNSGDLINH